MLKSVEECFGSLGLALIACFGFSAVICTYPKTFMPLGLVGPASALLGAVFKFLSNFVGPLSTLVSWSIGLFPLVINLMLVSSVFHPWFHVDEAPTQISSGRAGDIVQTKMSAADEAVKMNSQLIGFVGLFVIFGFVLVQVLRGFHSDLPTGGCCE